MWRYGQQRPCFIYHLVYSGTFETSVFERVLIKEELFERVGEGGVGVVGGRREMRDGCRVEGLG